VSEHLQSNVAFWNELTDVHEASKYYDLASFMNGRQTLHNIELQELGDVRGKSLLHLQCHFGMDSLSWSKLGAQVTGVDFSDKSISLATRLSSELNLDTKFVVSDIYNLPNALQGKFDIVFTSYGVLCWLQNLGEWAKVISHFLKAGGTFLIVEEHPLAYILDEKCKPDNLRIGYPYFDKTTLELHDRHSYADQTAQIVQPVHYEWTHTVEEILDAVISAGLVVRSFREYPFCMYQKFEWLSKGADDFWHPTADSAVAVPLLFSLNATKN
jgi:SAM-dependent methyltransferase